MTFRASPTPTIHRRTDGTIDTERHIADARRVRSEAAHGLIGRLRGAIGVLPQRAASQIPPAKRPNSTG